MLANRIAIGALWLVGARLATKTLDLVAMLVVARILVPSDFGVFALAATVLVVMEAVTDFSLANAIVQMREPPDEVYDTAFTLNVVRGLVLCALLLSLAWPFATLYGDDRLASIITVLAAVPILRGMASPRMAVLQRQLQFRPAFQLEAAGKIAAFCASLTAAILTRSHWALVAGMIAAPAASALLSYRLAPYRPRLGLTDWKPIFAFSGWLTLSNTVNTLNWQADRLFIGGQLGPSVLGQYVVGNELASLPTSAPVQPIMQVLYAGFAQLSDNIDRLRAAYVTSQCVVMAIALPIAISVSVFSNSIVAATIGPDWLETAFVVRVLAPVFALQMLTASAQSIAMVSGQTQAIFRRDLLALAIRLPLILMGLWLAGLEGVVWARVLSGLTIVALNFTIIRRILGISVIDQCLAPWRSYVGGALLAVILVGFRDYLAVDVSSGIPVLLQIGGVVLAGISSYVVVHFALWSIVRPDNSAESKIIDVFKSIVTSYKKN